MSDPIKDYARAVAEAVVDHVMQEDRVPAGYADLDAIIATVPIPEPEMPCAEDTFTRQQVAKGLRDATERKHHVVIARSVAHQIARWLEEPLQHHAAPTPDTTEPAPKETAALDKSEIAEVAGRLAWEHEMEARGKAVPPLHPASEENAREVASRLADLERRAAVHKQPAPDVQVCIGALLDAWDWLPNDVSQEPELETVRACMARLFAVVEGAAPDVQGADKLAGNSDVQAQECRVCGARADYFLCEEHHDRRRWEAHRDGREQVQAQIDAAVEEVRIQRERLRQECGDYRRYIENAVRILENEGNWQPSRCLDGLRRILHHYDHLRASVDDAAFTRADLDSAVAREREELMAIVDAERGPTKPHEGLNDADDAVWRFCDWLLEMLRARSAKGV